MSINSLANAAAARRVDVGVPGAAPLGLMGIAAASGTPPEDASKTQEQASSFTTAMNVLFGYIPTEVVTLYVAVAAALQPAGPPGTPASAASQQALWIALALFAAATPAAVWVAFATKLKAAGKPITVRVQALPIWEMTAALLAFVAWAFALPDTPFRGFGWYSPALASIAVLVVSTVLGMVAPLFQRPLPA